MVAAWWTFLGLVIIGGIVLVTRLGRARTTVPTHRPADWADAARTLGLSYPSVGGPARLSGTHDGVALDLRLTLEGLSYRLSLPTPDIAITVGSALRGKGVHLPDHSLSNKLGMEGEPPLLLAYLSREVRAGLRYAASDGRRLELAQGVLTVVDPGASTPDPVLVRLATHVVSHTHDRSRICERLLEHADSGDDHFAHACLEMAKRTYPDDPGVVARGRDALPRLQALALDRRHDLRLRAQAVHLLGQHPDATAIALLVGLAGAETAEVRHASYQALGARQEPGAADALLSLAERFRPDVAVEDHDALLAVAIQRGDTRFERIALRLRHLDAIAALGSIVSGWYALLGVWEDHPEESRRPEVARALIEGGRVPESAELTAIYKDATVSVEARSAAGMCLADIADPERGELAFQQLNRGARELSLAFLGACLAIGRLGVEDLETWERRIDDDDEGTCRMTCRMLRRRHPDLASAVAIMLLRHVRDEVKLVAIETLEHVGGSDAIEPLRAAEPGVFGDRALKKAILDAIAVIRERNPAAAPGSGRLSHAVEGVGDVTPLSESEAD